MEIQKLHRGRLIDHIQLVVEDLPACLRFYQAVLAALGIPLGGVGPDYFWTDELFVSTAQSAAAQGRLTGRHHLAFQASGGRWWSLSTKPDWRREDRTTDRSVSGRIIQAISPPS